MHPSDSLGSMESLRNTREQEDFLVEGRAFQGQRSQRAAQQGQDCVEVELSDWGAQVPGFDPQLAIYELQFSTCSVCSIIHL